MKTLTQCLIAGCLMTASIGANAQSVTSDLVADMSQVLVSSLQTSLQDMKAKSKTALLDALKSQIADANKQAEQTQQVAATEKKDEQ
ncbi:hypothetical protein ACFOEE_07595 [Pseudoalteromonas fenneropenaei]|uniref:Uncharacterized protein n=1 Tax=Pseudoalteromonas fenneropenaei TaxID=1737459 RepID=A0ABV7CII3_9GAMM